MPDQRLIDDLRVGSVEVLPDGALEAKLALAEREGRPLRVKLGVDPTAPDIHLGHTVVLRKLRQFQDLGHKAVLIIGDYTARIGDPSGAARRARCSTRAEIDANATDLSEQAGKILDDDPAKLEVRYNSEWLAPLTLRRRLRARRQDDRGAHAGARRLREALRRRISRSAMHEILYPLMQGYDSVAVAGRRGAGRHRPEVQPPHGPRPAGRRGQPPQVVMTIASWWAWTASRR